MADKELHEVITELIEVQDIPTLRATLSGAGEIEILQVLHAVSDENLPIVFRSLSKGQALDAFEQLDSDQQRYLLRSFTDQGATRYVNALAPDARVRLFDEMPAAVATKLLASISPAEREVTATLMGYEPGTAGRIMTPEFISLRAQMTAAQALDKVRKQAAEKETIYTLYVTSEHKRLEGVVTLRELLCAPPSSSISSIMAAPAVSVATTDDQEDVARTMQELDLLALPVVDNENRIVGIVTVDDAIDILEEEVTEDIYKQAGLGTVPSQNSEESRSDVLVNGSFWDIWKVRLPFLLITVVAGMLAGLVIEGFEEALESVVAVAIFIPLIMDMGGNVGTQSSTVFARGVVLGHISQDRFWRHLAKEVAVGASMGLLVGLLAGLAAAFWQGMPMLGVSVGIALFFAMTLAATLGFLVPFVLLKFGMDHAAGSAPIITSIKDIAGLLIYFAVAVALIPGIGQYYYG